MTSPFRFFPGHYTLDTIPHPVNNNRSCLQVLPDVPWVGQNHPQWRTTGLSLVFLLKAEIHEGFFIHHVFLSA